MKHLAEQISRREVARAAGYKKNKSGPELLVKIPRSWSRCGRCSGRSGGTFFTSGFLSTGEGSQCLCALLCLGREGATVKTEQYLGWAWPKARWEAAASLVSADTKQRFLCQRENAFLSFLLLKQVNK